MYTVAIIPSTVGYHWEEVYDAYAVFKEASWDIEFYTVNGKPPVADPESLKKHLLLSYFGMGLRPSFSPESKLGKQLTEKLNTQCRPIEQLDVHKTDVIYIPGGHGCLFDVNTNEIVHAKLAEAYAQKKAIGAVCHGTSCLAFVKTNGDSIIKNKKVIGFLDAMDWILLKTGLINKRFLPMPYWNEKKIKEAGGLISPLTETLAFTNPAYYVVDAPFVTGVGPKSVTNVAMKLINLSHT